MPASRQLSPSGLYGINGILGSGTGGSTGPIQLSRRMVSCETGRGSHHPMRQSRNPLARLLAAAAAPLTPCRNLCSVSSKKQQTCIWAERTCLIWTSLGQQLFASHGRTRPYLALLPSDRAASLYQKIIRLSTAQMGQNILAD